LIVKSFYLYAAIKNVDAGILFLKLESQNHNGQKRPKIIKSNHQSITTMPAKPCPEVPYLQVFLNTSRDGDSISIGLEMLDSGLKSGSASGRAISF